MTNLDSMKDLFSSHAKAYASFRPYYPLALYEFIFGHVKMFNVAWDAGTGNGQAAFELSKRFEKVHATDISAGQIEHAVKAANIQYAIGGETATLPDHSVDLVAAAQAIHWFNRHKFYAEVKRVARPDATVAVWGYGLLSVNSEIDVIVRDFYMNIMGPYWDPERRLIDQSYKTIEFPFFEIATPPFDFSFHWSLAELEGYITTWSSVQKYISQHGKNPVPELIEKLRAYWCPSRMTVTFPLFLRLGIV